ncbi:syncytin-1-like [Pongo pygmaeus]|uniref:syncytin-1-like n=1 Tax=Pongo pygmaeus TaxID=9600 RepID=UPI0023E27D51|nr:syncytin-1-like [Pongo pygmaeus]
MAKCPDGKRSSQGKNAPKMYSGEFSPVRVIKAVKLQMVLQMEPQMRSMTKIYCRPLDQPASPCFDVDDIKGTPPKEISTA